MERSKTTNSNILRGIWLVSVCVLVLFAIFWPRETCSEVHEEYTRDREFSGPIADKYRVKYYHMSRVISFADGQVFTARDGLKEFWEAVEIGDSLVKKAGSMEFTLYKDDTVLTFIPDCL